jgi:hypothetical protein
MKYGWIRKDRQCSRELVTVILMIGRFQHVGSVNSNDKTNRTKINLL